MRSLGPTLAAAFLLLVPACGGGRSGSAPARATALLYADPGDATQWRLMKNPTSTATLLVLDLLPPPGASGLGAALVLTADGARATWTGDVTSTAYTGSLVRKVSQDGGTLRILICRRDQPQPIVYGAAPVLSASLALVPGARPGPVALTVAQAGHLPAAQALPASIAVAAGSLDAR
jgi:hypothetical protein